MLSCFYNGFILLAAGFIQGVTDFGMALAAMPLFCLYLKRRAKPLSRR